MTERDYWPYIDQRDTTLTPAGAAVAVAVADAAPDCPQVGYVTGIAVLRKLDQPVAALHDDAVIDARNHAGLHGDHLVIDATETWWDQFEDAETTSVLVASAHGRVFRCR